MDMIEHLNQTVWCRLSPSSIHGVGVFALRDIPKGTELFIDTHNHDTICLTEQDFKEIKTEIQSLILDRHIFFGTDVMFSFPNSDVDYIMFTNRSDTPNFDPVCGVALRDIKKDEEITQDYHIHQLGSLNKEHFKHFLHD